MELYINNIRADIDDDALLAITYQATDYSNPTAIKNSYSKTVKLKGTETNNALFGEVFRLDRSLIEGGEQSGIYYDPRKKVQFDLFLNSEIIESGYLKLDSISNIKGDITYNCTLYGTLGDFFYNLAYSDAGEQRTLADLNFGLKGIENEDTDVIFSLTQSWINESWAKLKGDIAHNGEASDYFTAIPTYSGYYDDFSNDKALILRDTANKNYFPDITQDGTLYTTKNGFVLAEAQREMDEWEWRDLRANQQRIGVKLSKVIEAICDSKNNGGYEVSIDTSTIEPYYTNSFIMLDRVNYADTEFDVKNPLNIRTNGSLTTTIAQTAKGAHLTITPTFVSQIQSDDVTLTTTFPIHSDYAHPSRPISVENKMVDNLFIGGAYIRVTYRTSDGVDKYLYYFMTSYINNVNDTIIGNVISYLGLEPTTKIVYGQLEKKGNIGNTRSYWQFKQPLTIDLTDLLPEQSNLIRVEDLAYEGYEDGLSLTKFLGLKKSESVYVKVLAYPPTDAPSTLVSESDSYTFNSLNPPALGNVDVTKKILFANAATPLEFLTSFTKLFDLRFFVDIPKKKIEILPRNQYYINEVIDLTNVTDRAKGVTITPTLIEFKNYKYQMPSTDAYAEKLYAKVSAINSGGMLYSTPYNFNKETSDVLADNVYSNYVMYRLSSIYYNTVTDNAQIVPSVTYSPTYTYTLYSGSDSLDQKVNGVAATNALQARYDIVPKICCFDSDNGDMTDIKQALVFFDGFKSTDKIIISDTIKEMIDMNGEPCHLWLNTNKPYATILNEIPSFSKYLSDGSNMGYINSYDFKKPVVSFIQDESLYGDNCTLISSYWDSYLSDIYHKDSKSIEIECLLPLKPYLALRYFYYFDGALWVLAKVTDYNPASPSVVKCKFVKVYNKENYLK